jgi:hypothetical protein
MRVPGFSRFLCKQMMPLAEEADAIPIRIIKSFSLLQNGEAVVQF